MRWSILLSLVTAWFCGCAGGFIRVDSPRYTVDIPGHWQLKHVTLGDGDPTTLVAQPDPRVDYSRLLYGALSGRPVEDESILEDNQGFGESIVSVLGGGDTEMVGQDGQAERESAIRDALKRVDDLSDVEIRIFTWPLAQDGVGQDPSRLVFELASTQSDPTLKAQKLLGTGEHGCGMAVPLINVFGQAVVPLEGEKIPSWRAMILGAVHGARLIGLVGRVPYTSDEGLYCINLANMRIALQDVADWIKMRPEPSPVGRVGRSIPRTATALGAGSATIRRPVGAFQSGRSTAGAR